MLFSESDNSLPVCHQNPFIDEISTPFFSYNCPSLSYQSTLFLPDLAINVDFGPLVNGLSGMVHYSARTQLPLVIGLSNDTVNDYTHTVPITILPGVNMAASYLMDVRQVYTNGALSSFGLFEVSLSLFK